ncbi:MAG: hypothetical protein ACRYG8_01060 [Janthinobacterium lividum]
MAHTSSGTLLHADLNGLEEPAKYVLLWSLGSTLTQIAGRLGITRGQAWDTVRRLRHAGHDLPGRRQTARPGPADPVLRPEPAMILPKLAILERAEALRRDPEPIRRRYYDHACSFILRTSKEGGLRECTAPTHGHISYCPDHQKICLDRVVRPAVDPAALLVSLKQPRSRYAQKAA